MQMVANLERLTRNTEILTGTDLIYISRIMKNIARSPGITTTVILQTGMKEFNMQSDKDSHMSFTNLYLNIQKENSLF